LGTHSTIGMGGCGRESSKEGGGAAASLPGSPSAAAMP
jgi:hypothetical protein